MTKREEPPGKGDSVPESSILSLVGVPLQEMFLLSALQGVSIFFLLNMTIIKYQGPNPAQPIYGNYCTDSRKIPVSLVTWCFLFS